MGLFTKSSPPPPPPPQQDTRSGFARKLQSSQAPAVQNQTAPPPPQQKTGLFGSRKSLEGPNGVTHTVPGHTEGKSSGGLFSRRRGSSSSSDSSVEGGAGGRSGFLFSKHDSLSDARSKLKHAQLAEKEADEALARSRRAVQDAQEQISALELEAAQEHKAAKAKMKAAKGLKKEGGLLGRH